jgi:hypothetical protein
MNVPFEILNHMTIHEEIENHPAWIDNISGLEADKMLRGLDLPYTYVLRAGETQSESVRDYYVTYVMSDSTIRHTPFKVTVTNEGWCYLNGNGGGPYTDASIGDVIHLIMHCESHECTPMVMNR